MKIRGFEVCKGYEDKDICLPVRKTQNSVGYDFEAAEETVIPSMWKTVFANMGKFLKGDKEYDTFKPTLVKTGIKSYFQEDEGLFLANRSSHPGKKGLVLANSIGVIESDYYNNEENDGHIMFAYYNFFPVDIIIKKHDVCGQGFFQKFLISDDDHASGTRKGGFGSTDKE